MHLNVHLYHCFHAKLVLCLCGLIFVVNFSFETELSFCVSDREIKKDKDGGSGNVSFKVLMFSNGSGVEKFVVLGMSSGFYSVTQL